MGNLILNSLEIQGFRGFRHLQIGQLGRVNLIVGKNNVGKSSLLEALQLYGHNAHPSFIWEMLRLRDESIYSSYRRTIRAVDVKSLKYLFYGRREIGVLTEPIRIGPDSSSEQTLSISVGWFVTQADESGGSKTRLLQPEEYDTVENPVPRFIIQLGKQRRTYPFRPGLRSELETPTLNCVAITSNGLDRGLIGEFWDSIVLTELEDDVLAALRIVAPGVERLSLAGETNSGERLVEDFVAKERDRIPMPILRVAGIDEPIPLRSLGDGMQRVLGIALALANARNGLLLIDEFENGLHYSVLPDMWHLIFQVAHRLNIQVFATTHSWDCIEAFQQATQGDHGEKGMLIRLENRDGEIGVTLFDERKLGIATREQIEVR